MAQDEKKQETPSGAGGVDEENSKSSIVTVYGGPLYESDNKTSGIVMVGGAGGKKMITELLIEIDETGNEPGTKWGISYPRSDIGRDYDFLVFIKNEKLEFGIPLHEVKGGKYIKEAFVKKHLASPYEENHHFYSPFTFEEVSYEELQQLGLKGVQLGNKISGVNDIKKLLPHLSKEDMSEFLTYVLDNVELPNGFLTAFTTFIDTKYEKWTFNTLVNNDEPSEDEM